MTIKPEIIRFSSRTKDVSLRVISGGVRVGEVFISPSASIRHLGMVMDSAGLMDNQIKGVCGKASHSLWRIGKIRHLLDQASTEKLVHSFVTSKLDYCNSLFYGLPDYKIKKLQHIQNSAARLVIRKKMERYADMTPVLKELHWLPVEQRIRFKILCIVFRIIRHGESAPCYLTDLLKIQQPSYRTRTSVEAKLVPFSKKLHGKPTAQQYGDRALSVAGPTLWNSLPVHLRSILKFTIFKSQLKTFLFKQYYH